MIPLAAVNQILLVFVRARYLQCRGDRRRRAKEGFCPAVAHQNGYAGAASDCYVNLREEKVLNNQFDNIASNGNVDRRLFANQPIVDDRQRRRGRYPETEAGCFVCSVRSAPP